MPIPRALLLGFFFSAPAGAQIVVESSATVGASALQIETSLAHSRNGTLRSWSTPTLMRMGIGEVLELRAESDFLVREASGAKTHTGIADLSVGFKWAATVGRDGMPGLGLLFHTNLPTGSRQWRRDGVRPSLRGVLEWNLAAGARLGVMPGVERNGVVDGVETTGFLGLVLGKGWGKRFRSFLELELNHIAGSGAGSNAGRWNAGGTYLLGEGTQLDAALSLPATSSASDLAFTVVFSQLFRW